MSTWRWVGGQKRAKSCPCSYWMTPRPKYLRFAIALSWRIYPFRDTGGPRISWFLVPNGYHEMRGSWIPRTVFSVKPQNGSKSFLKSTFWAFFSWNFDFFPQFKKHIQVYMLIEFLVIVMTNKEILIFIRWQSLYTKKNYT